jgi:hypothetical protein
MPVFRLLLLLPLTALIGVGSAHAGALYRCVGKDGVTAFTSSRAGFSQCKLVGNFPAAPPVSTAPATKLPAASGAPTAATPQRRVEFRTAPEGVEPKAVPVPDGAKAPTVARGAVYKYQRNGVTHYTNRRPSGQRAAVLFTYIETCFACSASPGVDFNSVGLNLDAYRDEVAAAAAAHGVDVALIRAVMHAESAFNANAVSRAGAQGLMQLIPATASRFGVTEPFVPAENIKGGVTYLAWLLKRFDGDVTRATAGYNAGEGAVDRYGGVPPYAETMMYSAALAELAAPATNVATAGSSGAGN